jgi:hypothetical protein
MTINDLIFIFSFLFTLVMAVRIAIAAIGRRWQVVVRTSRVLGIFLAIYAAVLIAVGVATPRRFYAPGERRCFDDWCAAAISVRAAANSCGPDNGGRDWIATVEVTSVARRVRQRAADASADLEDEQGRRYQPCAPAANGKSLSDPLDPGESFRVSLPFRLPPAATPAGLVLHHGTFPGVVIIGEDHTLFHTGALHRVAIEPQP